jgi:ATP-binding cassette subfamily F protein 3
VLHVQDGHLHLYPGDYDYYLGKHAQEVSAAHEPAVSSGSSAPVESNKDRKRREAEERQARSREKKEREQAVKKLEVRIQELEKRQHELVTALEDQSTYDNPAQALTLNRELSHVVEDLERANSEWETAATRVQELDGTESRP